MFEALARGMVSAVLMALFLAATPAFAAEPKPTVSLPAQSGGGNDFAKQLANPADGPEWGVRLNVTLLFPKK